MFPTLHETTLTALPTNNGYGMLSDAIECSISETLNGEYSLSLTYPLGGLHSEELAEGRILCAKRDNTGNRQLFRIAEIDTDYIARTVQVYAPHISRDLNDYALAMDTSYSVDNGTRNDWISILNDDDDDYYVSCRFTFSVVSDSTLRKAKTLKYEAGQSVLSFLIDNEKNKTTPPLWELEFDNFQVKFMQHRGTDSNITVRYGKNLTGLVSHDKKEYPYYGCIPSFTYSISTQNHNANVKIYGDMKRSSDFSATDPLRRAHTVVDFPAEQVAEAGAVFDDSDGINATEEASIKAALATLATEWLAEQKDGRDTAGGVTVDFEYLDLAKAANYWSGPTPQELTADIGDYVTVIYGDVEERSEIVAVGYDVIKERYNAITAGQLRPTLAKTIKTIARR